MRWPWSRHTVTPTEVERRQKMHVSSDQVKQEVLAAVDKLNRVSDELETLVSKLEHQQLGNGGS